MGGGGVGEGGLEDDRVTWHRIRLLCPSLRPLYISSFVAKEVLTVDRSKSGRNHLLADSVFCTCVSQSLSVYAKEVLASGLSLVALVCRGRVRCKIAAACRSVLILYDHTSGEGGVYYSNTVKMSEEA